jgi:hypothetical protein
MKADRERHYIAPSNDNGDGRKNITELGSLVDYLQECDCRDEHEALICGVPIR